MDTKRPIPFDPLVFRAILDTHAERTTHQGSASASAAALGTYVLQHEEHILEAISAHVRVVSVKEPKAPVSKHAYDELRSAISEWRAHGWAKTLRRIGDCVYKNQGLFMDALTAQERDRSSAKSNLSMER